MADEYLDFDLCIEKTAEGYQAEVEVEALGAKPKINFTLPFSDIELENFILKVGGKRRVMRGGASPELEAAQSFGGRLFQTIFDNEVRGVFHSSMDEAEQQGKGLRIRLRLDDAPELADLPWEYLYNPDRGLFLSLSKNTPIVRYIGLSTPHDVLSVVPPLRILVVVSSPSDYEPLDVEREWNHLNTALGKLQHSAKPLVTLERLEEATLPALQSRLRTGPFHILHFIGHGIFDERTHDGALIFEDAHGKGMQVSGQYLGTLLHDHKSLRLVVLNACEGARNSTTDPFAGTAQCLVRQGIPAVIAMQFEVSDTAAVIFAREFYGALADKYPVDAALAEARKAIHVESIGVEWGTPVLYLRAATGKIFDVKAELQQTVSVPFALPASTPAAPVPAAPTTTTVAVTSSPLVTVPPVTQPAPQPEPGVSVPRLRRLLRAGVARTLTIIGTLTVILALLGTFFWYIAPVELACQVRAVGLNVRSGPGVAYDPPIHQLANGAQLTAVGRSADTQWLLIRTVFSQQGWVNARTSSVACTGNLASLPVAAAPPLPSQPSTTLGSPQTSAVADASTSSAASPTTNSSPPAVDLPLESDLPRGVRFSDVEFNVISARISSNPPTFPGFNPSTATGRVFAAIDISMYNSLPQQSMLVNANQVKLQLSDGRTYDEMSRWSTAISADSTQETTLYYYVPPTASWQGAKLVVRMPGKEQAVLALDGPIPTPEFPQQLRASGTATADQVSYRIVSAGLDLDSEGVRANQNERFLILTLQILNDNTQAGNVLVGSEHFRLRVDDTPLAPVNGLSEIVPVGSAKRVKVVFTVPADAATAELLVGQVGGVTASMPLSLKVEPSPSATSTAPYPSP